MSAEAHLSWGEANQRYLVSAIAHLNALRAAAIAPASLFSEASNDRVSECEQALRRAEAEMPGPTALSVLADQFQLSTFEQHILLLCAAPALQRVFTATSPRENATHAGPITFGYALATLPGASWSALLPNAPLRHWSLVELEGDNLTASPLRLDERILHFLVGQDCLDPRLASAFREVRLSGGLTSGQTETAAAISQQIVAELDQGEFSVAHLLDCQTPLGRKIAATAVSAVGAELRCVAAVDLPIDARERDRLVRLWEREMRLKDLALLIELNGTESAEQRHALNAWIDSTTGVTFVVGNEALPPLGRRVRRYEIPDLTESDRAQLWRDALGPSAQMLNGELDRFAEQFPLSADSLRAVGDQFRAQYESRPTAPVHTLVSTMWTLCRKQARTRLDDLAQRIDALAQWDDLVLPTGTLQTLREIVAQVRNRNHVHRNWGFAAKSNRGLSITALFSGPSGTGKTMAAEVLARDLDLDLYRIDLSAVVSKYIGETEKNLRRIFDAAEESGAILLFDEADALFGKRSEVNDSHDRYANIEVGYLLQRMEAYRGLAVLTTNLKDSLDPAFLRRLRFVVTFPFPDAAQRTEIWRRIFPSTTPTENLDLNKLARLNVAGGHIRNIALGAAFLAADARQPVRMTHLLRAAQGEYAKLEKTLTESETKGWA